MTRLIVEPEALDDLNQAAAWYDSQQRDLGDRFVDAMEELLHSIEEFPRAFPELSGLYRGAFRQPFPFRAYYVVDGDDVRVVAVLHTSRNPNIINRR